MQTPQSARCWATAAATALWFGGCQSGRGTNGQRLRPAALPVQLRQQQIESNAVAPNHDQVRRLYVAPQQGDFDLGPGLDDLFVTTDGDKSICLAKCRDASRSL